MDLVDLKIFVTVVREGGIGRAASKLHRVQSSVTTRIKQLESSMGVALFHRNKQRLHLSPSGEQLLSYAERILALSDEARRAVSGSPPMGALRLGALESTAASRLPTVLSAFHRTYPHVRIELSTGTNDALTNSVLEQRLDAAFVAEAPISKELAVQPAYREQLVLVSHVGHRRISRPNDVSGDCVIAFPNGCAYRRILQRWLGERRLATFHFLELSSYHAIVACVAAGTGVALVPASVLETVGRTDVRVHKLPRVISEVTTPLIWRSNEYSAPVLALRDLVATADREIKGHGDRG
jgi:DNA-binding transcriptional LysR family regulator